MTKHPERIRILLSLPADAAEKLAAMSEDELAAMGVVGPIKKWGDLPLEDQENWFGIREADDPSGNFNKEVLT